MAESAVTAASQLRKIKKPLIERRRRERINDYLNELKSLVEDATATKTTSRSKSTVKMEKAEILDMTVKYLRKLHHRHETAVCQQTSIASLLRGIDENNNDVNGTAAVAAADVSSSGEYVAGFSECARQVRRFLVRHSFNSTKPIGETTNGVICKLEAEESDEQLSFQNKIDISQMLWRHLSENITDIVRSRPSGAAASHLDQLQIQQKLVTDANIQHRHHCDVSMGNSGPTAQPFIAFYAPNAQLTLSASGLSALPVRDHTFPFYTPNSLPSCFPSSTAFVTPPPLLELRASNNEPPLTRVNPDPVYANDVTFSQRSFSFECADLSQRKSGDENCLASMWRPWSRSSLLATDLCLKRSE